MVISAINERHRNAAARKPALITLLQSEE